MRKILLACGIAAPILYIAADIVASLRLEGYSYVDQVVSELSAVGAPTRSFLAATGIAYTALVSAFAIGVIASSGRDRPLRIAGIVMLADAVVGFAGGWLFPMNPRGAERTLTDTMHLVYVAVIVLLMVGYIAFGAAARGKSFRIYSIATIVAMFVSVAWTAMLAPRIAAQEPTPLVGLIERVSVYGPVVWLLVLAVVLLRASMKRTAAPIDKLSARIPLSQSTS